MKITHRSIEGQHEATIQLYWYAQTGSFLIEAVGNGSSPEAAEASAKLMLGQARAKLNEVTAATVELNGLMADAMGANA
jgi:hypothetical protein